MISNIRNPINLFHLNAQNFKDLFSFTSITCIFTAKKRGKNRKTLFCFYTLKIFLNNTKIISRIICILAVVWVTTLVSRSKHPFALLSFNRTLCHRNLKKSSMTVEWYRKWCLLQNSVIKTLPTIWIFSWLHTTTTTTPHQALGKNY